MAAGTDASSGPQFTPQPLVLTLMALYEVDGPLGWSMSHLFALGEGLGLDQPALRTAVWRLKRRDVMVATGTPRSASYALNPALAEVFAEGDERIFRPHRAEPGDPWLMIAASVPEAERPSRHRLKRVLTRRGFGAAGSGLWISPDQQPHWVRRELDREDLARFVDYFTVLPDPDDLPDRVARWWDLEALEAAYVDYRRQHAAIVPARPDSLSPERAFATHVRLVTARRRLAFLDPGLPLELMPEKWSGRGAAEAFLADHEALAGTAETFVREQTSQAARLRLGVAPGGRRG